MNISEGLSRYRVKARQVRLSAAETVRRVAADERTKKGVQAFGRFAHLVLHEAIERNAASPLPPEEETKRAKAKRITGTVFEAADVVTGRLVDDFLASNNPNNRRQ